MNNSSSTHEYDSGVIGLILSGGQSKRMGNVEKGLLPFNGSALIKHVLQSLLPCCSHIAISCNRRQEDYLGLLKEAFAEDHNLPDEKPERLSRSGLIKDQCPPLSGPVAGIVSCLTELEKTGNLGLPPLQHGILIVSSCDMPFLTEEHYRLLVEKARIDRNSAHFYASRAETRENHQHFLPCAFDLANAARLADRWRNPEKPMGRSSFALKHWLSALSGNSYRGMILNHPFEDQEFQSVNSKTDLELAEKKAK